MHRILIGAAVGVVVLAAGAVGVVVWHRANRPPAPQGEVSQAAVAPAETPEPEPAPVAPRRRRPSPQPQETPKSPAAVPVATDTEATTVAPVAETASNPSLDEKINGILNSLTREEQEALMRAISQRAMQERAEQRRYELPSDRRLRVLERNRNAALRLSDVQRQQIDALKESLKPKIDAATSQLRQQQETLREQVGQLMSSGDREAARALFEQMGDLRRQSEQATAPIDEEYKTALSGILTPEQQEAVTAAEASGNDGPPPWAGNRRGPGR
jgi:Spy/CpxP family protein refolding chaperone